MAISIGAGDNVKKAADQAWNNFQSAETPLKSKYSGLTNPQKASHLSTITNWTFGAAPSAAREDALFVAIALLYLIVGYIARKFIQNGGS